MIWWRRKEAVGAERRLSGSEKQRGIVFEWKEKTTTFSFRPFGKEKGNFLALVCLSNFRIVSFKHPSQQ